ncbi:hypothetical protein C1645_761944 [Glomus cerebriforme]|uniref:Uncharacterized protein n=1 Tax=Glomus cerebriforme TaxID=658196 RepID=A0A397TB30_9GLOM|nr:hypothetical protein C1645_761944 [Glomus cerebriforme]
MSLLSLPSLVNILYLFLLIISTFIVLESLINTFLYSHSFIRFFVFSIDNINSLFLDLMILSVVALFPMTTISREKIFVDILFIYGNI